MRLSSTLLVLSLTNLLIGCGEPEADLSTLKTHRSGAITFKYPKNWKITEGSATPAIHDLFVETPGDALVIIQSYPSDSEDGLSDFSKAFSESAANEIALAKIAQPTFTEMTEASGYEWITEDFRIDLLGESIPHQRLYGTKVIRDRRVFLIFQVATEDLTKAKPGFEVIRDSLRSAEDADGAVQPATAVDSKAEANEKTKPESEGRSQ